MNSVGGAGTQTSVLGIARQAAGSQVANTLSDEAASTAGSSPLGRTGGLSDVLRPHVSSQTAVAAATEVKLMRSPDCADAIMAAKENMTKQINVTLKMHASVAQWHAQSSEQPK